MDRISNAYEGSDLPTGSYAQEDVTHLSGDLTLRFQFVAPETEEYDAATWQWFAFRSSLFGLNAESLYNSLKAAQEGYAKAFHKNVAPKLARQIANELVMRAITLSGETSINLDYTLTSDYRHDAPLNVTVRLNSLPSGLSREDITALEIMPVNSASLPEGSRILVEGGRLSYRTNYASGYLFRDSHIRNDLSDSDGVLISTPLNQAEQRNPREEDKELKRRLLNHLNDHIEYYHKAIWLMMSADRRYMMLDGFTAPNSDGRSVASVVDNQVIGVIGNSLVMPVARGMHLDTTFERNDEVSLFDHYKPNVTPDPLRIALPTKGVYAESVMGACNSCEHKEEDRFWRWEESPIPDSPTPIAPINTESRRAEPSDLTATPPSQPIIAMQNAPAAPAPQGLAAALQLLGNPNVFKDITGLEGNQRNAIEALKSSLEAAQQFGSEAADVAKSFGEYATNLSMQSATSQDMDRIQRSIQTARGQGLINDEQANDLTHSALRAMVGQGVPGNADPRSTETMLNTIRSAREQGSINEDQERNLSEQALGRMANSGEQPDERVLNSAQVTRVLERLDRNSSVHARDRDRSITARPVSGSDQQSFSYTVPGFIPDIRQEGDHRCWAAAAAILLSWRAGELISAREAALRAGSDPNGIPYVLHYRENRPLEEFIQQHFTQALGFSVTPSMSLGIQAYREMLQEHGPLWIQADRTPSDLTLTHFFVVYGIYGDGSPTNTYLRIMDPWVGHREQRFDRYVSDYERIAIEANQLGLPLLIQIAHL
jgi:hypothetical protein